ncbi:MAG: alkaline phosphatase D [Flavobacteriales bacterium]|jgi:alkaline phosphatase D
MQTEAETTVHLEYWPIANKDSVMTSDPVLAQKAHAHTATLIATGLEPGRTYSFAVIEATGTRNEEANFQFTTQPLWQYRTDPPEFTIASGSCAYTNDPKYDRPGKGYGDQNQVYETISGMHPDMMLWLGDNVYLREVDLQSKSGFQYRYSHFRSLPELKQLMVECPHYAIWDDHDFGPNDSDRSFIHSDWSQEVFEEFWANPSYGLPGERGITSQFRYMDIDFFLMDNRMFRTNYELKTVEAQVWGKAQEDWLIEALKYSKAPFKIVATGGQFLSDAKLYENHAQYEAERQRVLDRIEAEGIKNVVFLTGDRHHTELTQMNLDGDNPIYDLTVSPLTSTSYDHSKEPNTLRVDGTVVGERNFALLTFSGKRKERAMTIRIHSNDGGLVWEKKIESQK